MSTAPSWHFGPFRLDPAGPSLWRDDQLVPLPPKPLAVLAYLVTHAGQVVTKDALLQAVWPDTIVTEGVLKTALGQVRQGLGERAQAPRYIATVHRRGYRFLAPVTAAEPPPPAPGAPPATRAPGLVVGREDELASLQQRWRQALHGARQLVFLTGEAGIGKTTVVDAFVAQLSTAAAGWIGRGQCIEPYGAGEAYLPLLEALGRLGRGPAGASLVGVLRQQAPSWLVHLPALVSAEELDVLQRRVQGTTQARMLRELAEAVETLTAAHPLVLVLEDLHWSDGATIAWLASVARRREAARLLVLGTYRPADAIVRGHPVHRVVQELQQHGQGAEVVLGSMGEAGVAAYLAQRFAGAAVPAGLAEVLSRRTHGHPLFLVAMVDELVRRGVVCANGAGWTWADGLEAGDVGVPESLRQLLEQQLAQLPPEDQALLEAASVAGREGSAAALAAAHTAPLDAVEARCAAVARRGQFLTPCGLEEWPDGTVATRYRFRHDLYQEMVYARVPVGQRAHWHRQIGARLEAGYGPRAAELAAELAEHFVRGRHAERAVPYLQVAGAQAVQRSAHQEAVQHLTRGLEVLATLPETPARAQQELDLQIALGPALIATQGRGAPAVEQTYARARALCQQIGETPQRFSTLQGLCGFYRSRGALLAARELGEQLYQLAQREADPTHRLEAHGALGGILFYLGDYAAARTYLEPGIPLIDPAAPQALARRADVTAGVTWCLGYPAQALQRSQEALAVAQTVAHPYSLGLARHYAAQVHHRCRDASAVQAQAEALLTLATAHGFPLWAGFGTYWRGWTLAMQGQGAAGLAQLHQGMTAVLATGQELGRPFCLVLLAEAAGQVGQAAEALRLLDEALAVMTGSGRGDLLAEAYRLQGEFLWRQAGPDAAHVEASFQQALTVARRQQAKSWELRAAMSLSRLWQYQGKRDEARQVLAPIYSGFTEGFDTADLQEAKARLETLA